MARALVAYGPSPPRHWEAELPKAKHRFKKIFPRGFRDPTYLEWERDYKWAAHLAWRRELDRKTWANLLAASAFGEVARRISKLYVRSKLNMLALYEWMALREALASDVGSRLLSAGLYELVHGGGPFEQRIEPFALILDRIPQRQTRLPKCAIVTLFPFVARPNRYLIVKPMLMKRAAARLGFDLAYAPRPNGRTYAAIASYLTWLRKALASWQPRDVIDLQGFLWVTCSEEYEEWPWE